MCSLVATRVQDFLAEAAAIRAELAKEGRLLARRVCRKGVLAAARETKLSQGYLSQVANGKKTISPDAYLRLWWSNVL